MSCCGQLNISIYDYFSPTKAGKHFLIETEDSTEADNSDGEDCELNLVMI